MRAPRMLRTIGVTVAGLVTLTSCGFNGAYDLPLPGHPVSADDSYEVTAEFQDILNVVPRSPVMVDDVVVGEVTDVERVGWHAKVTLRVKDDVDLPDNAIADIKQVSLLGEKYVALEAPPNEAPSSDRLADGDNIPMSATGRNPEVEEVLGALSFLLSGGGVAQLGTITHEANQVMSGRTDRLRSMLDSLEGVVGTLDSQKADIIKAMESLDGLARTLNEEKDTIGGALDAVGPAIDVLADQHDELIQMLGALQRLGKVGTRVISASKDDVLKMLAHLQPILNGLQGAGQELAPGINLLVSFPFPKAANDIIKGDYANTIARVDINLANLYKSTGIPDIELPDPGEVIDQVTKCLQSGSLTSVPCSKVLSSLDLLGQLKDKCKKGSNPDNPVCKLLGALPDLNLRQMASEGLLSDPLDGLTSALDGLTNGLIGPTPTQTRTTSTRALMGGVA